MPQRCEEQRLWVPAVPRRPPSQPAALLLITTRTATAAMAVTAAAAIAAAGAAITCVLRALFNASIAVTKQPVARAYEEVLREGPWHDCKLVVDAAPPALCHPHTARCVVCRGKVKRGVPCGSGDHIQHQMTATTWREKAQRCRRRAGTI